uniref:Protein ECT2 n=1 Tax=Panagrellus redivivus TaxID=6233 RepID=A0A7E4UUF6_PANRE
MAPVSKNAPFGGSGGTASLQPAYSIETLAAGEGASVSKENVPPMAKTAQNTLQPIHVAVFVDGSEADKEAYDIARQYLNLQVATSKTGSEFIGQDNVAFVFANFEAGSFRLLQQYRCISTQALKVQYHKYKPKPFPKLKASRPLYCFSMTGLGFALHGFQTHNVRRAVDLIHFMSGHVRRNYSSDLRLISKDTRGESYRFAVSLGHRVLTMEWLEECWKKRDDMNFVASDKDFMDQFCLKCFGGLCLYFLGFDGPELDELREKTKENGGTVVEKLEDATHIVISQDAVSKTSRGDLQDKHHAPADAHFVTLQWFWKSIHYEFCNSEELFPAFTNELRYAKSHKAKSRRTQKSPNGDLDDRRRSGRKGMSKSELEKSNASSIPDHMFSSESLDSVASVLPPTRRDKRYYVCMEMLQTEENYTNCLELIVSLFKEPLERMVAEAETKENNKEKDRAERPILSKQQIMVIFGKIPAILDVHRTIRSSLSTLMKGWDDHYDDAQIGWVWAVREGELSKAYPPYVNSYDEIREMLETCLAEVPKFHTFVKLAESDPKCKSLKITLKDMLIKPVQRLPSVVLLLNEIIKRTDKSHKDMIGLVQAVKRVSNVLQLTNESRKQTDAYSQFLSICNQIDDYPAALINSSRTFKMQVEVIGLNGDGFFSDYKGRNITLFMFNDFVAFAKNRLKTSLNSTISPSIYGSTRGTLNRNMSFLRFREKKKYRLLSMHRVPDFRLIRYDESTEVVIVKIRVEDGDYLFVAQPDGETNIGELIDFFHRLCQLAMELSGKPVIMEALTEDVLTGIRQTALEDYQVIESAMARGGTFKNGGSIRRRSTLRRAVSNVSLGISNGLSKFASRAHLSFINETSL